MNQGLEALERLLDNKVFISLGRVQGKKQFATDVNTIEKELKEYYQLRDELNTALNLNQCQTVKAWAALMQKKLEAFEIIKNKRVCVWAIVMARNVEEYNFSIVNEIAKPLTQEEYDLLKEVKE